MSAYTSIANLETLAAAPARGILSQTVYNDDMIKVVHFGFAADEELSEHTASMPAILQIITGDVRLTLGPDTMEAGPGTWVHMPANLSHSVYARTPTIMLLTLIKRG